MKNLVWLASYPKSGNTWLRTLLCNYYSNQSEAVSINELNLGYNANDQCLIEMFADVEPSELTLTEIENLKPQVYSHLSESSMDKVFCKTHSAYYTNEMQLPLFPREHTKAVIYIVRNPLDVVISFAHHENRSIDYMIDFMSKQDAILGQFTKSFHRLSPERLLSWTRHVRSWLDSDLSLHLICYEDLLKNTEGVFRRLIEFIEGETDEVKIKKAIRFSQFDNLKLQEENYGFNEKSLRSSHFFREGKSGGWRNKLSKVQIEKVINEHQEVMAQFNYLPEQSYVK